MKTHTFTIILNACCLFLSASSADAAVVAYVLTGMVDRVEGTDYVTLIGQPFRLSISYDIAEVRIQNGLGGDPYLGVQPVVGAAIIGAEVYTTMSDSFLFEVPNGIGGPSGEDGPGLIIADDRGAYGNPTFGFVSLFLHSPDHFMGDGRLVSDSLAYRAEGYGNSVLYFDPDLYGHQGRIFATITAIAIVPEPTSIMLGATSLVLLLGRRRVQRTNAVAVAWEGTPNTGMIQSRNLTVRTHHGGPDTHRWAAFTSNTRVTSNVNAINNRGPWFRDCIAISDDNIVVATLQTPNAVQTVALRLPIVP